MSPLAQPAHETADAVVVGAGILGAAIALELGRAGRKVVVVDAGPGPGAGSTGASSAIVRMHYSRRDSVVAALDCYHDWLSWSDYLEFEGTGATIRFIHTGALVLDGADTPRRAFTDHLAAVGINYRELDATHIEELFPSLDARTFGPPATPGSDDFWRAAGAPLGGFYYDAAGYIDDPQLAARNICASATYRGARFRFRDTVAAVLQHSGRATGVRLLSGETISSPVILNAAGPASDALNKLAGVTDDMSVRGRPLRTETHEISAPPGFTTDEGAPFVTDLDMGVAFRPHGRDRLHISSIEPQCDALEWIDDPWQFNNAATQQPYVRHTLRVARRMPALKVPHKASGIGALYDVTPDWTPIFDRSMLDGFYLACGTSGNSFKLAPMVGRAMAAIIAASENGLAADSPPISIAAAHLDETIDLALFSRRRRVDRELNNVIA
ncbi:MAG: FAD-dependent oxidoreductase [Pseudonocardiales bacterium]|nr:MAG: FAD-dependent oxidoreductase [Pseudonocardiales bacterium]